MRHGEDQGWWSRNWGWVAGVGCGCLLLPLLLVGACVGGLGWMVSSQLDTGAVFEEAQALVEADPEVRERLGAPLEIGWFGADTNIRIGDDEGEARYTRPVTGPDGSGQMTVEAVREDRAWRLVKVVVRIDGERIDVLANAEAAPDADATGVPATPSP